MKNSMNNLAILEVRLEQIEKQNKRLKLAMITLVLIFSPLLLLGAKSGSHDGNFGQISARGITIHDASGKELVVIGTREKEGTGISIFNNSGARVISLGIPTDGKGNGIMLADAEGRPRIGLGMNEGIPGIALANEKGVNIIAMGGNQDGYGLQVTDDKEVRRIGLGFKAGNAGIMLYDEKGQYVRGMVRQKDGLHYASYFDREGKEVFE